MSDPQCQEITAAEKRRIRLERFFHRLLYPAMNWIVLRVHHCDSAEYHATHPIGRRWLGGLKLFTWTWVCGHGPRFSFRMGNIYWRLPFTELSASKEKRT